MIYGHRYESPLGTVCMESDGEALCGLWFADQEEAAAKGADEAAREEETLPVFAQADSWLDAYFIGEEPGPVPKLRLEGTPFRRRGWEILQTIPYGQTVTYGQIARQLAEERGIERMSAQAVGGAVGHNPVSLIVPCHRVVGVGGELTGYAGGIERKAALLALERG